MSSLPEDSQHVQIAHKGTNGDVVFANMEDDSCPAKEFWDRLDDKEKNKFMALFKKITDDPSLHLRNKEKFKKVRDGLWEFKCNSIQMRMFTFRHCQRWYLVHGFRGKKEDKLPESEVKRAIRAMKSAKCSLGIED